MDNPVFETVADALCRDTDLEELEARGTLRLALKQAGLEARTVTVEQMRVVVGQLLAGELRFRDVPEPEHLCERIGKLLESEPATRSGDAESPEAIFRRLAGR